MSTKIEMAKIMEPAQKNRYHAVPLSYRGVIAALNWLDPLLPDVREELTVDGLMETACAKTGLSDYGDLAFTEPLSVFLRSINEDERLRRLIRILARRRLVTILRQRLLFQAAFSRQPEILQEPIRRPIIIASLPRTGSTLLQRLLAQDPKARSLAGWETLEPIHDGGPLGNSVDPRILRARRLKKIGGWLTSAIQAIHELDPEQPEECGPLLRNTFVTPIDWLVLEEYGNWYLKQSPERLAQSYLEYRRQLQFLQWERPVPDGGHWVLKSPFHSFAIPSILQIFPDAVVVLLHRDPTRVVTSFASLSEYFYDVFLIRQSQGERHALSRRSFEWCEEAMRRAERARTAERGGHIYDMSYHDLVSNPVGTIRSLYDRYGYPFSEELERGIGTWLSANPQGKHGRHRYRPEQFGISKSELTGRFNWYMQAHGLKPEKDNPIPDKFPALVSDLQAYMLRDLVATGVGSVVISFAGQIDAWRLRNALRLLLDSEPILGCRFVGGRCPHWQRRDDLDACAAIELWSGGDIDQKITRFLTGTIDPSTAPLLKAAIARGKTDVLYLQISHAVCDGPSAGRIVARLASIYKVLGDDPSASPPASENQIRDLRSVTQRFSLREKIAITWGLRRVMSLPRFSWGLPNDAGNSQFWGYLTMQFPPERVRLLLRYGRKKRATLTAIMLAGLYFAARQTLELTNDKIATISTTTDLRRFLPRGAQETAPSNFVGPIAFRIDPQGERSFDEVLVTLRDQLKDGLRDPTRSACVPAVVLSFPGLNALFRQLPFERLHGHISRVMRKLLMQPVRRLGIANLGEFEPEMVVFGGPAVTDMVMHGPLFYGPGVGMVFSTFCDHMSVSVGFSSTAAPENVIRRLLQALDASLPGWEGNTVSINALRISNQSE